MIEVREDHPVAVNHVAGVGRSDHDRRRGHERARRQTTSASHDVPKEDTMTSPTRGEKLFRLKADELQEQLRGWSSLQFWWVEAANGGGPNYLRNYMTHIA